MTVYRITLDKETNPFIEKEKKKVMDALKIELNEGLEPGAIFTVEALEMSESEYANLPEWSGP